MPRWVRWLQPLLSGVFTVDNLDYVRRDAYLTGVAVGPVDVERLRRYCFIGERGLTIYEPGLGALEMFLTARLFMYRQVYFHRTVRAIDLDLAEVFGPSIRAIFGDGSPAEALSAYADLDEYALLHQAALWARGEAISASRGPATGACPRRSPTPGGGSSSAARAGGRTPRSGPSTSPAGSRRRSWTTLGPAEPGRVAIDLATVDARPAEATATDSLLAVEGLDGRPAAPLSEALARLPAYSLIARRYRRGQATGRGPAARRTATARRPGTGPATATGTGRSSCHGAAAAGRAAGRSGRSPSAGTSSASRRPAGARTASSRAG